MVFKDFTFNLSEYGKLEEVSGTNAVIYAIKNLLLSRPGNFPFHPSLGVDIGRFQFELLDDYTIKNIKTDILTQVAKVIPNIDDINIIVKKVDEIIDGKQVTALGIFVASVVNGVSSTGSFLVVKDQEIVYVFDEVGNE